MIAGDHLDSLAGVNIPPTPAEIHILHDLKSAIPESKGGMLTRIATLAFLSSLTFFVTRNSIPFFQSKLPSSFNSSKNKYIFETFLFFILISITLFIFSIASNYRRK